MLYLPSYNCSLISPLQCVVYDNDMQMEIIHFICLHQTARLCRAEVVGRMGGEWICKNLIVSLNEIFCNLQVLHMTMNNTSFIVVYIYLCM